MAWNSRLPQLDCQTVERHECEIEDKAEKQTRHNRGPDSIINGLEN